MRNVILQLYRDYIQGIFISDPCIIKVRTVGIQFLQHLIVVILMVMLLLLLVVVAAVAPAVGGGDGGGGGGSESS